MKIAIKHDFSAFGQYRRRVRNCDGSVTPWSNWEKNLILDNGLNQLASGSNGKWGQMMIHAQIGTGNTATSKQTNGTGITLSQATNQVTASGSFFASTDVGAILKYGTIGTSGTEQYITGFTSAFVVTVSSNATVGATDGTVWQVQQTALVSRIAGDNGTYEADVITFNATGTPHVSFKRGYQFAAVGGATTVAEIGFSWQPSGTLWSRVVVPGSGDALTTGQIYEVEYLLTVNFPGGAAQAAIADISGATWNTAGTYMLETASGLNETVGLGGSGDSGWLEPMTGNSGNSSPALLITASWTQKTLMVNSTVSVTGVVSDSNSASTYSAGTFTLVKSNHWNIGTAVATIYGISGAYLGSSVSGWSIKFTTPIAKDSSHTIDLSTTMVWGRALSN